MLERRLFNFKVSARSYAQGSYNRDQGDSSWGRRGAVFLLIPYPEQMGYWVYVNASSSIVNSYSSCPRYLENAQFWFRLKSLPGEWRVYDEIKRDFFFSERADEMEPFGLIEGGVLSYLNGGGELMRLGSTMQIGSLAVGQVRSPVVVSQVLGEIDQLPYDRKHRRGLRLSV